MAALLSRSENQVRVEDGASNDGKVNSSFSFLRA
jgi:hypothetical protein